MASSEHIFGHIDAPRIVRRKVASGMLSGVTMWFLALMVIGCWIHFGDGLSRPFIVGDNVPSTEALGYEAYTIAWIFAGISLPFLWLHGLKLGFRWTESLLLWFVFNTIAYAKDFAYLKPIGVQIYVTDVTLVLMCVGLFLWPKIRIPRINTLPRWSVIVFFAMGTIAMARGMAGGYEKIIVLRDYAIAVYAAFLFITLYVGRARSMTFQLFLMLVSGQVLQTVRGIGWYLAQPGMRRYVVYGTFIAPAVACVALAVLSKKVKPIIGWPLMALLSVEVIIGNHRAVWVSLGFATIVYLVTGTKTNLKEMVKPFLGIGAALLIGIFLVLQTDYGAKELQRTTEELASGVLHAEDDGNAQFRFLAWAEAGRRFLEQPFLGEGFGVPFTFERSSTDIQTHNTYVTVLYKLGLTGFVPFFAMLGIIMTGAWSAIRKYPDHPDTFLLRGALISMSAIFFNGMVNPLLEIPFLGSIFWLNLGVVLRMTQIVKEESKEAEALAARAAAGN